MTVEIRSLSKPYSVEVSDTDSLLEELQNYRGLSVAVHITRNGMIKPYFVDVMSDGRVVESYGAKQQVTIDYFTR